MHRAKNLVVVCNTLMHQWQGEIEKFCRKKQKVVFFYGKEKLKTPLELSEYDVVIATPDGFRSQKAQLESCLWDRVITDESHQEDTLMTHLRGFPTMARYCMTGTPYDNSASDISDMLSILGLPSYTLLSKNPQLLAYVLDAFAVRYSAVGTFKGQRNLDLPAKTEAS